MTLPTDALTDRGMCGTAPSWSNKPEDRCRHRAPVSRYWLSLSYARQNFVDNTMTDQSFILRFIEDNWQLGRIGY